MNLQNSIAATLQPSVRTNELSKLRMYLMKFVYLATFLGLGYPAWSEIINPRELWVPLNGVAYSFWAAYATLMIFGLRYPLKMLPLLVLQLFYKSVWIIGVALPLWSAGHLDPGATGMLKRFSFAVVVDLIVIPWPYVFANYVKKLFKFK